MNIFIFKKPMRNVRMDEITKSIERGKKRLLDAAEKAKERAYNPYSGLSVGAALLTDDGKIIIGTNFESASYGNTICAERSALVSANAMGNRSFKAIAIIASGRNYDGKEPILPCGACRQMLFESSQFSGIDMEVVMSNANRSRFLVKKISQLLPYAFGLKNMGLRNKVKS